MTPEFPFGWVIETRRNNLAKSVKQSGSSRSGSKKETLKKAVQKKTLKKTPQKTTPQDAPEGGLNASILDRLYDTVIARQGTDPSISHSARLLSRGRRKIAQKFGEEAVECLIEAVAGNPRELIGESADVLYHLIVLWVDSGIHPDDVWNELKRREGTSGIAEKASRPRMETA